MIQKILKQGTAHRYAYLFYSSTDVLTQNFLSQKLRCKRGKPTLLKMLAANSNGIINFPYNVLKGKTTVSSCCQTCTTIFSVFLQHYKPHERDKHFRTGILITQGKEYLSRYYALHKYNNLTMLQILHHVGQHQAMLRWRCMLQFFPHHV
jgi:hypothetical protein